MSEYFLLDTDGLIMAIDIWEIAVFYSDVFGPTGGDWSDIVSMLD